MKLALSFACGFLIATAACCVIAIAGHIALSEERLAAVVASGFAMAQFEYMPQARISDPFSDCALLIMEKLRAPGALADLLTTRLTLGPKSHPCDVAGLLLGVPGHPAMDVPPAVSYLNYPFGPRHLAALALSGLEVFQVRAIYLIASCLAAAALLVGAMRHSGEKALAILPLVFVLCFAFSFHTLGPSLTHAPPMFTGLAMLAVLLLCKEYFRPWPARVALFAALGVTTTFLEMLNGSPGAMLALAIVLNQLFYGDTRGARPVWHAIGVAAIFIAAYVLFTALRLAALKYGFGEDIARYFTGLLSRLGSTVDDMTLSQMDVLRRLWDHRSLISPLGRDFSGALIGIGAAGWIVTLGAAAWLWRNAEWRGNVIALGCGTLGLVAWIWLFPNHSYVHPQFIVRLLGLAAGFGVVAALLTARARTRAYLMRSSTLT
jgi:hypothetical protein